MRVPGAHQQILQLAKSGPIDLVFLGDSITAFWPRKGPDTWTKLVTQYHAANFGVGADTTENVLWRINNGELDGIHPKVLVLLIGTNNIAYPEEMPEWTANGIKKIIEVVHQKLPETKILLLAIFPRKGGASPIRTRIEAINKIIASFDDGKTVRYLDFGSTFLNDKGELPREIMPDFLHPAAPGYEIWYQSMQPLLDELMK